MMLTDSEKAWLKKKERILREGKVWGAWCYACPNFGRDWAECYAHQYCPIFNSHEALQEAALFEARVAAKLANIHFGTEDCPYCSNHINVNEYCSECKTASTDKRCLACRLKYARLKVEEEMDAAEMDK
jgi:hypothetical protein